MANGLRTDHPIPELPFVDDAHIPLDDPVALEAVGRTRGNDDMWGREDRCREGGWVAFTTDPVRHDLAWCVRSHPVRGRSVVLYRDEDASSVHMTWWGAPLLFRSGGYWWDGMAWYRPSQIWDRASEQYVRRTVPAATTITAADLLDTGEAEASRGRILGVNEVDPGQDNRRANRWFDDLALWAERRGDDRPLTECVVSLSAPELAADQLIGVAEMAAIAEVAPSTLRAYQARGESEVPPPQAVVAGRSMWARPVAEEWTEKRRRSSDGVKTVMSVQYAGANVAPGIADLWKRFDRMFFSTLWQNPGIRKRWALRWRTEDKVREVATDLGWTAAGSLDRVIPLSDLSVTIRRAILDELAEARDMERKGGQPPNSWAFYGISPPVARMFDWLIRHDPGFAVAAIGEIVGQAEDRFNIPREAVLNSLGTALSLDGKLDHETYTQLIERTLPPDSLPT